MKFDAIVIGSGLGGLTVASKLAKDGYKVGVFEQHFIPGGYATNFKRKGYTFDVSLHGIGGLEYGGNLYGILSACDVIKKIEPLKNSEAYSIRLNDEIISIPNNKNEYKKFLLDRFKTEQKGIEKLFVDIDRFNNGFTRFVLDRDNSILKKIHKDVLLFITWSGKTVYEVINKYVKNEEFIRIFTALWTYYGLPPKELSAVYFFVPWISYHEYGKYYIKGGAQKLSDSFVEVIKDNGGEVYLNAYVENILYEDGAVKGIKLKNGKEFKSKWIISNINPISTFNMLPKEALSDREKDKIINHKIGCSLLQLYIGLDCNPRELGIPDDEVFFLEGDSHEADYKLAKENQYEKSGFLLTNYNGMDSNLNPDNKGVITITYIDNYDYWSNNKEEYKKQKEEVCKKIIARLEKYYKGISNHIVISELATPKTMERYTKNPEGAVYGYGQYKNQAGGHRLRRNTTIKNLSLVGAWTNPGGGYEGTMSGGISEAIRISKIISNFK